MMNAEEYLIRSQLFRRLKNDAYGQLVELYAARLAKEGARSPEHAAISWIGSRAAAQR